MHGGGTPRHTDEEEEEHEGGSYAGLAVAGISRRSPRGCGDDDGDDRGRRQRQRAGVSRGWRHDRRRTPRRAPRATSRSACRRTSAARSHKTIAAFNEEVTGVTAKLLELPESADQQRNQLVQRSEASSDECDVMGIDIIWTAEFASQGWLKDLPR